MKLVILAGGLGTRLAEETDLIPKPMVTIGNRPILWHIMKLYASYGINEFIICLGYKGYLIAEFFYNYAAHNNDMTVDLATSKIEYHTSLEEDWRVTLANTGEQTQTGGRLRRIAPYLDDGETFCMTYGDGLSDVNISKLIAFHKANNAEATLIAVKPPARFGATVLEGNHIVRFAEKPQSEGGYINGGFFVLEPQVIDRISGDDSVWEQQPLESLASERKLCAYLHDGFWQPMDTLRDRRQLERLWASNPPWKNWD